MQLLSVCVGLHPGRKSVSSSNHLYLLTDLSSYLHFWGMYMCVCAHVCMCVHVCMCECVCMYVCVCLRVHVCVCVCVYVCVCVAEAPSLCRVSQAGSLDATFRLWKSLFGTLETSGETTFPCWNKDKLSFLLLILNVSHSLTRGFCPEQVTEKGTKEEKKNFLGKIKKKIDFVAFYQEFS